MPRVIFRRYRYSRLPGRNVSRPRLLLMALVALLIAAPAFAAHYEAYAWAEADLALVYPAGWNAATSGDADSPILTLSGGDSAIVLTVLSASTDDGALRSALDTHIAALNLLPLQYSSDVLYGRSSLRVDAVSADRQQVGSARSARLPDRRALLVAARAPVDAQAALEADLDALLGSLVFSASVPPVQPTYHPVWNAIPADQPVLGLAASGDRVYALDMNAVRVLNAQTGDLMASYPFEHPSQPSAIAVDAANLVYVGDSVCRCILVMSPDGRWLDTLGNFGDGAPFSLAAAPDGTLYATDKGDSGYQLRILGEPRNRAAALNFNASAPPLVTLDSTGQVWVIEWLSSLIDGSTSGAVSLVSGEKPSAELRFWLEKLTPDTVTAMSAASEGDLVFATRDQGILVVSAQGEVVESLALGRMPRQIAFGADGTLYAGGEDGTITTLSRRGLPDRFGASALALRVPVLGTLAESTPQQDWTYNGAAGERVTLSAVDQTRTDVYAVGLDLALHLFAPDGSEVAYNDDQRGADLFGIYDAQIPDLLLPQTGTYTVRVERRQGQGTYVLGVSENQPLELSAGGVTRIEGSLQDVFPVQRWAFAGRAGETLTLTMRAESGTLDPALAIRKPDGSLLAYNDDASDTELKNDSQLTQVRLPADGTYVIEASRYEGVGGYSLVIVDTD